eukprot:gene29123-38565_t
MKRDYAIDTDDAGLCDEDIARFFAEGSTPEDFVSWFAEKYDLDRRDSYFPLAPADGLVKDGPGGPAAARPPEAVLDEAGCPERIIPSRASGWSLRSGHGAIRNLSRDFRCLLPFNRNRRDRVSTRPRLCAMTRADFVALMGKLSPYLTWLERRLKPRFTFLYNPWLDRVTGLIGLILAIIVFLPIPFGNMLPALALSAFGLGVAERDGVVGLFGGVMAMVSIVVLAALPRS